MSDTSLNRFLASGTAAERAAFVPDPPIPAAGPDPLYLWFETDTGLTYAWDGATWVLQSNVAPLFGAVGLIIDGGGAVITTGVKGYVEVPFAHTITAVTLLADISGSIVVDVWRDTYANAPPTVADTITAAAKPTLSGAIKSQNTTLTGWSTAGAAGSVYGFNVDSVATLTRVTLSLTVRAT